MKNLLLIGKALIVLGLIWPFPMLIAGTIASFFQHVEIIQCLAIGNAMIWPHALMVTVGFLLCIISTTNKKEIDDERLNDERLNDDGKIFPTILMRVARWVLAWYLLAAIMYGIYCIIRDGYTVVAFVILLGSAIFAVFVAIGFLHRREYNRKYDKWKKK